MTNTADGITEPSTQNSGASGYDALDGDFRAHYQENLAARGGSYDDYSNAYRYGYDLGVDPRYNKRDWKKIERDARSDWEANKPGTWEQIKETVRYAREMARNK